MNIFPGDDLLLKHLSTLFPKDSHLQLISREHLISSSTFPAEIVKCKVDDKQLALLCKYLNGMDQNNHGHRGAVKYEAKIYCDVLSKLPLSTPIYYGIFTLEHNDFCMIIEYLEHAELLYCGLMEKQLEKSVEWIADFHNLFQNNYPEGITKYTAEYYLIWAKKVDDIVVKLDRRYPWLIHVSDNFRTNIQKLTEVPLTLIHGEYYPNNILIHNSKIKPIDWESAAIAPGEIDLAACMDGLDEELKKIAVQTYISTRWPNDNFDRKAFYDTLLMAQIYFHYRWIGGKPHKVDKYANRFEHLKQLGTEAGYL